MSTKQISRAIELDRLNREAPALAAQGNQEAVVALLERGANPDIALIGAASGGQKELVLFLLARGANTSDSALFYACGCGQKEIVLLLCNKHNTNLELQIASIHLKIKSYHSLFFHYPLRVQILISLPNTCNYQTICLT